MAETVYLHEAQEFIHAMEQNNSDLINALTTSINNLAMNTGNKTTREYNELKAKYEELEKSFKKSDFILKSIITMYTFVLFERNNLSGPLDSDKIVEIINERYRDIQHHEYGLMPDTLIDKIINIADEVHERLIRR